MCDVCTNRGFGLIEVLFVLALGLTLTSMAVPLTADLVEETRVASAARNLAARIGGMRIDALKRSTCIGMRFQRAGSDDYSFELFVDGNGNGVRTAEISAGIDVRSGSPQRIADQFPGVMFGLLPGIPDADAQSGTGADGVRLGSARILTMSPDGTSSSGTVYVCGRRTQYAIRVLGATGRTRVLYFHPGKRQWIDK
jgi:prepilin-type N-terminal cleavage/methylation domain-containing protein